MFPSSLVTSGKKIRSKYLITWYRAFIWVVPHGPHNSPVLKTKLGRKWNGPFSKNAKLIMKQKQIPLIYHLNDTIYWIHCSHHSRCFTEMNSNPWKKHTKVFFVFLFFIQTLKLKEVIKNCSLRSHRGRTGKNCISL